MERQLGGKGETVTKNMERNGNIDFLRTFACFGVVAVHTINGSLHIINNMISLLTNICIPLFFLMSGYLMFQKEHISYNYVLKKCVRMLITCFLWELLYSIAAFLYYHEFRNFIYSFLMDFVQKGLFFHFWFFGSLILLYLLAPVIRKLEKKSSALFMALVVGLITVCVVIDILQMAFRTKFVSVVPQSLRLWLWVAYFSLGGLFATKKKIVECFCKKHKWTIALTSMVIVWGWLFLAGKYIWGAVYMDEYYYGALPIIVATCGIFGSGMYFRIPNWLNKGIKMVTPCTMGIYIIHPFVLSIFVKFVPSVTEQWLLNIVFWFLVILSCSIGVAIMNRIPLIKELNKL